MQSEVPPTSRAVEILRRTIRLFTPVLRPLAGRRFFPLWAVIEHTGRKTGRVYRTPVVAVRTADGFLIPVPFGPRTEWVNNVRAAGRATLRWRGNDYSVIHPKLIDHDEASRFLSGFIRASAGRVGISHWVQVSA